MRTLLMLCLVASCATAQAQNGFSTGHVVKDDTGKPLPAQPMAWRYATLEAAQDLFERRAARQAPNAILTFRLPKVDPAGGPAEVALVQGSARTLLPMATPTAFMLDGASAPPKDALVVVNRFFPPGVMNHPNVRVRSSDVPNGVVRMGDARLACQAQMAMAKTAALKVQAVLGAASLFGFDVCNKMAVSDFDAPGGPFDTIVIDDGDRHASLVASTGDALTLGDRQWTDEARVSFTLHGQAVQ